jgi:ankyrin repeat protein
MSFRKLTVQQYLLQTLLSVASLSIILIFSSCGNKHTPVTEHNSNMNSAEDTKANLTKEEHGDIQLRITNLTFDPIKNIITYSIQNNGKEDAINVQLHYSNISQSHAEKEVVLDNQQSGTISFSNITVGNLVSDQTLQIDFKAAPKAKFKFQIFHQNKPIQSTIIEEEFVRLPLLKLLAIGSTNLVGNNKKMRFRIEEIQNRYIELGRLKLRVAKSRASGVKIYYNSKEVTDLLSNQEEANFINTNIQFCIEPGICLQVSVDLQLEYEGKPLSNILTFTWTLSESEANQALIKAAKNADKERIQALLQLPAVNINIVDDEKNTALHLAIKGSNEEIVKMLLKANNINLELKNHQFGHTPLHEAIHGGNLKIITTLIAQGADVNATSGIFYETPLFLAVIMGDQAASKALLSVSNIDVNISNNQGSTPLHSAVSRDDEVLVKLLLTKGARKNISNLQGKTPMDFATMSHNQNIKKLMGII